MEDIGYGASRSLSRQVFLALANPQWIAAHRNVLISGPTGIGKSFIACALANAVARAGREDWGKFKLFESDDSPKVNLHGYRDGTEDDNLDKNRSLRPL